jgi:ceramide glucosyltransferase
MVILWLIAAVAASYQLVALAASLRQWRRPRPSPAPQPLSILKPVRGLDRNFREALRSHLAQEYSAPWEILIGAADPQDPALAVAQQLHREFPQVALRVIHCPTPAANRKVGVLTGLARHAQYPFLLVNDSDIVVPPDYLNHVTAPLIDAKVGIVTTLYRASGSTPAARWEALGVALDFAPSVLVAPLVGIREFGLGATLVFRAADLAAIGGFTTIADYLADDYQLARHITQLGKAAYLSEVIVETGLGQENWAAVWRHQVRWARTIRVCRGGGFLGLPTTQTGIWILLAMAMGAWSIALVLTIIRLMTAFVAGVLVLQSPLAKRAFWLAPLWDLWAFVVWLAALAGREVVWRDSIMHLTPEGKLIRRES